MTGMPAYNRKGILPVIGYTVFFTAAAVFLNYFPPGKTEFLPQCISYSVFHFYCPGCGCTRALYLLSQGDLAGSLRQNLLLIPAWITIAYLLLKPPKPDSPVFSWSILVVFILFMILRNIPVYPLSLLAPFEL